MTSSLEMDGIETLHELTGNQIGILYQCLLSSNSAVYQNQIQLNVVGRFSPPMFVQAVNDVIARHQVLRSIYLHEGLDQPATIVNKNALLPVEYLNLNNASQPELQHLATEKSHIKLPLDEAPLMRLTSVELNDRAFYLILDFHHIIFDGWSNVIFFNELKSCYQARLQGATPQLPESTLFSDYVSNLTSINQTTRTEFWKNKLAGLNEPTPLPLGKPLPNNLGEIDYSDANHEFHLDKSASNKLRAAAKQHRVTLNSLIAAAWALTLSRYTDKQDVLFGVTVNGRTNVIADHEHTMGLFVNTVPLRVTLERTQSISDFLLQVQRELGEITQHEQVPLSTIHKACELDAGIELFEILLVFQSFPAFNTELFSANTDDQSATALPWHFEEVKVHENSPLPLTIEIFDHENIGFLAMFNHDRLNGSSVKQLIGHLNTVLREIAQSTDTGHSIDQIAMLAAEEIELETADYRQSWTKPNQPATLSDAFAEQVKLTPNAVAISDSSTSITYTQLAALSNTTAQKLQLFGIRPGDRVIIYAQRDRHAYVAMLAVMQVGAIFVPMDSVWPIQRVCSMAKDCNAKLVLVDESTFSVCSNIGIPVAKLNDSTFLTSINSQLSNSRDSKVCTNETYNTDHAYIMYTSGTSGTPKGVIGKHSATLNRFSWMWREYPFQRTDKCVQKTPWCFVDSIWELFGPLLKGVHTHIIDDSVVNKPALMLDQLLLNQITHLVIVPSLLSVLLDEFENVSEKLIHLRLCTVSGEALPDGVATDFLRKVPNATLLNLYGSTETTADVCFDQINVQTDIRSGNIGRAIDGVATHVLSRSLSPMPLGAIGELCISGKALSGGYVGQTHQQTNSFVNNPFADGELYKTGDLAARQADGTVHLHGRKDNLIKINGRRIDLVEISGTLTLHPDVSYAITCVSESKQIICWYQTPGMAALDHKSLMLFLEQRLPVWMKPAQTIHVSDFPRLTTGKINVNALLDSLALRENDKSKRRLAATDTEKTLATIWKDILPDSEPHLDALFIESGGDSIDAMRFNARVQREFDQSIAPRLLLVANLEHLARSLDHETIGLANTPVVEDSVVQASKQFIEPLLFSSDQHTLYGVFHHPQIDNRDKAVLLCTSIGHEYMKLHRLQHAIASLLSVEGYNVLRFDYTGVGNSSGSLDSVSLANWLHDIKAAASELLNRCNKKQLIVVGSRLGVPLLLRAQVDKVSKIVAVDPIYDGTVFVEHLNELHQYALNDTDRYHQRPSYSMPFERFGYTYSEALLHDIKTLTVSNNQVPDDIAFELLESGSPTDKNGSGRNSQTVIRMLSDNKRLSSKPILANTPIWSDFSDAQSLIMDHSLAEQIAAILSETV